MEEESPQPPLPRVTIQFCTQCKWMLRAAYFAQELLSTFSTSLGEVALQPSTGGTFKVHLYNTIPSSNPSSTDPNSNSHSQSPPLQIQSHLIWDRKTEGGFPETKELKRRVRDIIDPSRNLGHVDGHKSNTTDSTPTTTNTQETSQTQSQPQSNLSPQNPYGPPATYSTNRPLHEVGQKAEIMAGVLIPPAINRLRDQGSSNPFPFDPSNQTTTSGNNNNNNNNNANTRNFTPMDVDNPSLSLTSSRATTPIPNPNPKPMPQTNGDSYIGYGSGGGDGGGNVNSGREGIEKVEVDEGMGVCRPGDDCWEG